MRIIRWGMIGCGDVTEVKSGPGFYKARHSMLYGVTNRSIDKAYDYAKRHKVEKVFTSARELIEDKKVDIVYIATPPGSHKEYALMCAEAGKPCYIEKPMALNYEECLEIVRVFAEKEVKGFVAYYRRRLERFTKTKELIDAGEIGAVRFVRIMMSRPPAKGELEGSWRVRPEISGGGIFMDIAVHGLDVLDYILGEIESAQGIFHNLGGFYEPEDTVAASFRFKSGVIGSGLWCFVADERKDEIEIVGEKGSITLSCFGREPIKLKKDGETREIPAATPEHIQQNLIQTMVDELNGEGTCPSTLESAARTAKVCEMIYGRL